MNPVIEAIVIYTAFAVLAMIVAHYLYIVIGMTPFSVAGASLFVLLSGLIIGHRGIKSTIKKEEEKK